MNRIGVCLSGGGAKGLAHIGALKVLAENNITISAITGTSIGALLGGMYAYHKDIARLERFSKTLTKRKWSMILLKDLQIFGKGVFSGNHVMKFLESELPRHIQFEDLQIPMRMVSVDIITGKPVYLSKGSVLDAIRASISLPLTFEPVKCGDMLLVDGSCRIPAPVRLLDTMGVDKKILFGVGTADGMRSPLPVNKATITHVYMMDSTSSLINHEGEYADVVLNAGLDMIDTLQFWRAEEAITAGVITANKKIKEIKDLLYD